jgi:hypothetical protein
MKTRSSSGVGQKVDLGFDVDTLRIFDIGDEEDGAATASAGGASNSIAAALKRTASAPKEPDAPRNDPSEGASVGKVRASTDSTKLRDFLNNLGE